MQIMPFIERLVERVQFVMIVSLELHDPSLTDVSSHYPIPSIQSEHFFYLIHEKSFAVIKATIPNTRQLGIENSGPSYSNV